MPEVSSAETALMSSLTTISSGPASSSANSDTASFIPESTTAETTLMSTLTTTASGTPSASANSGSMEYSFQEGDTKQPVGFLSELKMQSAVSTTVSPTSTTNLLLTSPTTSSKMSVSAVVNSRLVFNSSSLAPSESVVLNATKSLLSSRLTNLSDSTKVLNITYEKKTDTSYVLLITFGLSNISMPESADLRNNTYVQVQNSINNALNKLLNDPNAEPLEPKSSVFKTSANQVEGSMEYSFQEGVTKQPVSFLSELKMQSAVSTTVSPTSTTNLLLTSPTTSSKMSVSAVVNSRLVFNSSSLVPSESLVLNAIRTLLSSRLTNLSDSTKVLNITYEKKTDNSFVVIFIFSLCNISMPDSTDLRNNTYIQVQNSINKALNIILTGPGNHPFNPQISNFTSTSNKILGDMVYNFLEDDINKPSSFLRLLSNAYVLTPTKTPNINTTQNPTLQTTTTSTLMGTVLIYICLVFKNLTSLPSEAEVLNAASTLLDASVRMKRDVRMQKLNNPVSIQNVTYQKTGNNSYTITFGFKISNVNISSNLQLRNESYDSIQNTVNMLLNKILNGKSSTPFNFPQANYTGNDTMIQAVSEYVFVEGNIQVPSGFLAEILKVSGLASMTPQPTVPSTTIPGNSTGGFPGWALAIIIPCSIAIILIPTWITLCCMLCGCCADIRRRYSRRRSYNVQYTTRNGLF
ncbi:hypothetical protein AOLI_G00018630 [Acnodon oligacanthus]